MALEPIRRSSNARNRNADCATARERMCWRHAWENPAVEDNAHSKSAAPRSPPESPATRAQIIGASICVAERAGSVDFRAWIYRAAYSIRRFAKNSRVHTLVREHLPQGVSELLPSAA